jgi:hypothetical protein
MLGDLKPSLVVLDGRTEGMSLHGLKITDNDDVAKYGRLIERPLAQDGRALLALDHVTKDRETRGRYGIGGVHKLNGLTGAAFTLETRTPIAHGVIGRSTKDRPGQLRRHGLPGKEGTHWLADLIVDATTPGYTEVTLAAPVDRSGDFRPTVLMRRLAEAMGQVTGDEWVTQNAAIMMIKGKREQKIDALGCLVKEGYVERQARGTTLLHRLVRPFGGGSQVIPEDPDQGTTT